MEIRTQSEDMAGTVNKEAGRIAPDFYRMTRRLRHKFADMIFVKIFCLFSFKKRSGIIRRRPGAPPYNRPVLKPAFGRFLSGFFVGRGNADDAQSK
jgi:hypothetical protein